MSKEAAQLLNGGNKPKSLDDFCRLGRYCLLVLVMGEFLALACLSSMVYMVYAGATPSVVGCTLADGSDVAFEGSDICVHLKAMRNSTGCTPRLEYQFRSVNVDFDFLCEESHQVKNSISMQMLGVLVGAAVFGQLSDLYGRRKNMIVAGVGMTLFCALSAFSPSLGYFTFLRTGTGFFTGGLTAVQGVFMIENIPRRHRMWIQSVIAWSPNFIIFPYIAYLCEDWATVAGFSAVIGAIATLLTLALYESPRWLIQKGQIEEAREIMEKIRKMDRCEDEMVADELEKTLVAEQEAFWERESKQRSYTFYHLFCTWKMISWTITLLMGITTTALTNYALLYNMEKLSGSIYWNSAVFGVVRWAVNIVVALADYYVHWFGRRIINQSCLVFVGGALGGMAFLYYTESPYSDGWVIRVGTIAAMSVCSQMFLCKYIIANELYPTAVRNLAVSALSTSSRIGSIFAPQLFYLTAYGPHMPYFVLTILIFVDVIAFGLTVPETKGRHLENHLPPKEERIFYKKKNTEEDEATA